MSDDLVSPETLSSPAPHDAQIVALIRKTPGTMNEKELDDYLRRIRELRGSAPTKRAAIAPTQKTKEKTIDLSKFL
jgi:hypothetical protein